ncbi:tetratricopeptide repeat protein [Pseudoduganella sp. GCM10020061]|uniref:tetratricopeptide repeat protein n=1 Tax=Pseudoduganella sp. GCM10020061 TaxID=3317345 RepID=UPI003629F74F
MKRAAILLSAALLGGCAAAPVLVEPQHLYADARFAAPTETVDTSTLFDVSPEMRAYLRSPRYRDMVRNHGLHQGLIHSLYRDGDLKLDYDATMTRTAAQTFETRSGNCLSLVIMTAAFAREVGIPVTFQNVRVEETWSRQGSLYVGSNHVNVLLTSRVIAKMSGEELKEQYLVDFLPQADAVRHKAVPVGEHVVVAMYANNRAVEALARGRVADAYWWTREALSADPGLTLAYNTLGAVYQRHGDNALAAQAFRAVLARDRNNLVAMQNLLPVLEELGSADEAKAMRARLASLQPDPPYHYFQLGQAAMQREDFKAARELFAREVARAPYNDEFHLWYAMASLRLGETDVARRELALAQQTSTNASSRARYAAKLEHMRGLPALRKR